MIDDIRSVPTRQLLAELMRREEERDQTPVSEPDISFDRILLMRADELDLSVRSRNCLKNEDIVYIGDLVTKSEADMLDTPNLGRRSLNEIKEVLAQMNLRLGVNVAGWPPAHLRKEIEERENERRRQNEAYARWLQERPVTRQPD